MEYITNLTTRGRVTIPKAIRDTLELRPSDRIHFTVKDGEVILEKVTQSLKDTPDNSPTPLTATDSNGPLARVQQRARAIASPIHEP
jgi:AbrB family looped-hinge helix DNA binding protein